MATKREERMKEITERLQDGLQELFQSERYAEYLRVMSQFHRYSFNNTLLIAMQRPDATRVAGYHAWEKKFNRHVRKGESGIQIIAPESFREKREQEKIDPETGEVVLREDRQPETEEVTVTALRFKVTTVFDISQTEGDPLPELDVNELTADVERFPLYMEAIQSVTPVPIRFDEVGGDSRGYYDSLSKEIVIQSGMSELQTMKTAIHESAHAVLHDLDIMQEQGTYKDQITRECEAESVAYTVLSYFGLDTSDYSFPYIAGWSNDKDMKVLRSSMDTIRKTVGEMIEGIESGVRQRIFVREEQFRTVDLFGAPALFSDSRVNLSLLPEGLYRYELRGADYDPGMPVALENHVRVNHAGTILTAFKVELPEDGHLWLGDGLNFMEGKQTIEEYRYMAANRNREALTDRMRSEIGRANETLYLSDDTNRYILYQFSNMDKETDGLFREPGLADHGQPVEARDYVYGYSAPLREEESLESFESRVNRTADIRNDAGNNLLVRDVLVVKRDGEARAYYVDAKGWTELPNFVEQRRQAAELSNKMWHAPVTMESTDVEVEQHEGLWHPVERRIVQNEIFYLMRHNEYGDSVGAVIVDSEGNLVAQELEHGFDQGAMEAVREYWAEKGIVWEPDKEERKAWRIDPEEHIAEPGGTEVEKPFIARYYVVNDAYGVKVEREYQYFEEIEDAISAYHALPNHLDKQLGMENSEQPPSQMPLISCQNGLEKMADIKSASLSGKWIRSEVADAYNKAKNYLDDRPAEIAYELGRGKGFFLIQTTAEGWYDYMFYDKEYHERDGGTYDQEECSVKEAMEEIFEEEHLRLENCRVLDLEDFTVKVEEAERKDLQEKVGAFHENISVPAAEEGRTSEKELPFDQNLSLRYYVAECMEFPVLGEYHDADTLEEAMKLYEKIPAERMHGIKGIGFQLYDRNVWQGEIQLMSAGKVDTEMIGLAEQYKNSAVIQQAVSEILKHYPDQNEERKTQKDTEKAVLRPSLQGKGASSKKESVLKALRERQSKLKNLEKTSPEQKKQERKKGEVSL